MASAYSDGFITATATRVTLRRVKKHRAGVAGIVTGSATQLFLRRALRTCTPRVVNTWRYARGNDKPGIQPRKVGNKRASRGFPSFRSAALREYLQLIKFLIFFEIPRCFERFESNATLELA